MLLVSGIIPTPFCPTLFSYAPNRQTSLAICAVDVDAGAPALLRALI